MNDVLGKTDTRAGDEVWQATRCFHECCCSVYVAFLNDVKKSVDQTEVPRMVRDRISDYEVQPRFRRPGLR